jgi:hypothetical protein
MSRLQCSNKCKILFHFEWVPESAWVPELVLESVPESVLASKRESVQVLVPELVLE